MMPEPSVYPRWVVLAVRVLSRLSFFVVGVAIVWLSLKPSIAIGTSDKLAHLVAYGGWTFVSLVGVRRWPYGVLVAVLIFAASLVIEVLQPFFGRTADWRDAAANGAGVVLGSVLTIALRVGARRLANMVGRPEGQA